MARFIRVLVTALLLLAAGCAEQESPGPQHRSLPSGLTVITRENRAADVVSVQVWVRDGAVYEAPADARVSGVLAATILSASTSRGRGEMRRAVESVGGVLGKSVSEDHVCYEVTVPAKHLALALDILSDAMLHPLLTDDEVENGKAEMLEQSEALLERPVDLAVTLCLRSLMPGHPTARPPATSAADLASIGADDVKAWWSRHYVGPNMVVVVVGSVDPADAADRAEQAFGGVAGGEKASPRSERVTWPTTPALVVERAGVGRAVMVMGFPGPSVTDANHMATDVLMMALANGRSSPLSRALVEERGLASSVGGGWYTRAQASPCFVWMELDPENVAAAEAAVVELIGSLAEAPLAAEDLERGKALLSSYMVFASETAPQQAAYEGYWFVVAGEGYADAYLRRIREVTVEDLRAAVEQYLRPDSRVTVVLEPAWVM
jgi:zinc protease